MHKHDIIKTGEKIIPKKMDKSWGPPISPRVPIKFLNIQIVITKQIAVSTVLIAVNFPDTVISFDFEHRICGGPTAK